MVNRTPVTFTTREAFANELRRRRERQSRSGDHHQRDANATQQSVIHVMEAAQMAGFGKSPLPRSCPA